MNTKFILSISIFFWGMLIATAAQAQLVISDDSVKFPDDTYQTTAVPTDCPHSEFIVWDTNAETWVCESDISPIAYSIGDTGPAGGIVFWTTEDGLHGLEAAPYDQGIAEWGCSDVVTGATRTGVLTGDDNTTDILVACGETDIAARLADNFSMNGFDDFYLPSQNELGFLYAQRADVGGFFSDFYWGSSESNGVNAAWTKRFSNGGEGFVYKLNTFGVRAVRAF